MSLASFVIVAVIDRGIFCLWLCHLYSLLCFLCYCVVVVDGAVCSDGGG